MYKYIIYAQTLFRILQTAMVCSFQRKDHTIFQLLAMCKFKKKKLNCDKWICVLTTNGRGEEVKGDEEVKRRG